VGSDQNGIYAESNHKIFDHLRAARRGRLRVLGHAAAWASRWVVLASTMSTILMYPFVTSAVLYRGFYSVV